MIEVNAEFPEALEFLFEPARYKVLHGGRGGAKSWGMARALLIIGAQRSLRVACCREIQKSIKDSVHQILEDQIKSLGLQDFYEIQATTIKGRNNDTEFTFHGLKHNIDNIKSLEGCDVCWVEEARNVSANSWSKLTPTIRKDDSEIWVSFNDELEDDPTYKRFIVRPPTGAIVKRVSFRDNPWFNKVLRQEMEDLKANDYDEYLHVYEGHCKMTIEGAIFAEQLRNAKKNNQITRVPYDASKPVNTFWDLGFSDSVAIWFVQKVGFEYRAIDYLEDSQKTLAWYIAELQKKPYVYDTDYLPHDGSAKTLAAGGKSIEMQARELKRNVQIVPIQSLPSQINSARTLFPNVYFDEDKCEDGIHALRHYQFKVDAETGLFSKEPLHNQASHGASAFMALAVTAIDIPVSKKPKPQDEYSSAGNGGWMGV